MIYDIYKQVRDAAWRFLIDNDVRRLPVSLSQICRRNGIILLRDNLHTYLTDNDRGATYLRDGVYNIVVNGTDSVPVQRYTIAHELGHIFLQHPMNNEKYGRSFGVQQEPKSPAEYQAERFAIDILAPACVLWGIEGSYSRGYLPYLQYLHESRNNQSRENGTPIQKKYFPFS